MTAYIGVTPVLDIQASTAIGLGEAGLDALAILGTCHSGFRVAVSGHPAKSLRGIGVWMKVWNRRPHPTLDDKSVCGLCRALTPPKHHRGSRAGSGPGTGSNVGGGTEMDEKQ